MNKEEFLLKLEAALRGMIPEYEIDGHINYYREYLSNFSDGKNEEEKLIELGDPRLIAKTIIDTAEIRIDSIERNERESKEEEYTKETTWNTNVENGCHTKQYFWNSLTWYQKVFAVLLGVVAIIAILGIIIVGVNIFFTFILPILIVVFAVKLIIRGLRR